MRVSHFKITIEDLNWARDEPHPLGRSTQVGGVQEGVTDEWGFVLSVVTESWGCFEGHLLNFDDLEEKGLLHRGTGGKCLSTHCFLNCPGGFPVLSSWTFEAASAADSGHDSTTGHGV